MKQIYIAPSVLAADFSRLGEEIDTISKTADFLHLDVMDGHYVPNISFGIPVISSIRKKCRLPFDVHLMIQNPEKYFAAFANAGADYITFHLETSSDPQAFSDAIRSLGKKPGISIHPDTPSEKIYPFLPFFDLILVMTVRPGFGGQKFMEEAPERIAKVRKEMDRIGSSALLSVDGGIDEKTIPVAASSGADVFVAGSSVFGMPDSEQAVLRLKKAALN